MALKTLVKLSSVSNLSDARYGAGMGVEYLGFPLEQNAPDSLDPQSWAEITSWVSGVKLVAEMGQSPVSYIREVVAQGGFDAIEVSTWAQVEDLADLGLPLIWNTFAAHPKHLEAFVAQASWPVNLLAVVIPPDVNRLSLFQSLHGRIPLWVAGLQNVTHVEFWLDSKVISGISLPAGKEIRPGYRDFAELMDILEFLEAED